MKLRTVAAAVMIGVATLACGGGGGGGDWEVDYSVDLTAPWTEMGLPIDSGSVIISDDSTLSVQYADSSVDDQIAAWTGYYSGNGFSENFNQKNDDGSLTAIYEKDGKTYTLVVVDALGQVLVTMSVT